MVPDRSDDARTPGPGSIRRLRAACGGAHLWDDVAVLNRDLWVLLEVLDRSADRALDWAGQAVRLEAELVAAQAAADRTGDDLDALIRAVNDARVTGPVLRALHGTAAAR